MKQYIDIIEKNLASYDFGSEPFELYEPIRYVLSLGGKRLRPVLTLMAYELFDNKLDKAVFPAMGVEVFHNFTLLHDDIMDNAPLRRGKSTVHKKWDTSIAILSGDVMLVRAYELLSKTDKKNMSLILSKFSQCAVQVCEGQQYDMQFETATTVTEEEYISMIQLKTAVLLAFSLELGAILGGAEQNISDQLYQFGINIGLGFQLKDDLLDVFADSAKFGKQVGGDIISNKKTYLLIKALELAEGNTKETLKHWLSVKDFDPAEKVHAVKEVYDELGIQKRSEDKMNEYFDAGIKFYDELPIEEGRKAPLRELTLALIDREK